MLIAGPPPVALPVSGDSATIGWLLVCEFFAPDGDGDVGRSTYHLSSSSSSSSNTWWVQHETMAGDGRRQVFIMYGSDDVSHTAFYESTMQARSKYQAVSRHS